VGDLTRNKQIEVVAKLAKILRRRIIWGERKTPTFP
jgi:hypothetical protein